MLGIFKSKPILSDEDFHFQVEAFKWLMKHFGGDPFFNETFLVLPTKEFFPAEVDSAEDAVIETFAQVKKYAGLESWPCELIAQESDVESRVAPTLAVSGTPASPHGTFSVGSEKVKITYNPALASDPVQLVSTLAHEL